MEPNIFDCLIHDMLLHKDNIKGPVVDLKLMGFYQALLPDDLPYYWYEIISGDTVVGKISLRLGYNTKTLVNGHVGYEIQRDYQGHNYSYYALELIKSLAKDHGYRHLIVSTSVDNIPSQKTVMKANGKLMVSDYEVPKDHIFYVIGKPVINVYQITL